MLHFFLNHDEYYRFPWHGMLLYLTAFLHCIWLLCFKPLSLWMTIKQNIWANLFCIYDSLLWPWMHGACVTFVDWTLNSEFQPNQWNHFNFFVAISDSKLYWHMELATYSVHVILLLEIANVFCECFACIKQLVQLHLQNSFRWLLAIVLKIFCSCLAWLLWNT